MTDKTEKRKYNKKDKSASVNAVNKLGDFMEEKETGTQHIVSTNNEVSNNNDKSQEARNIVAECIVSALRKLLVEVDDGRNDISRLEIIKKIVNDGFKID